MLFFTLLFMVISVAAIIPVALFLQSPSQEGILSEPSLYPNIFVFSCFYIAAFMVMLRTPQISFEKKIFLDVFDAHSHLERFINLSGSTSQQKSDFDKCLRLLEKASKKLLTRKTRSTKSDLLREAYEKYSKLGELIQTKILFYLKEKDTYTALHHIKPIVNTFADANSQRLVSCLKSLEAIPHKGDFNPPKSLFMANPRLRSVLIHLGRFSASIIVVTLVAFLLSQIFSVPLAEFAVYTLGATFLVFVTWEFKS